VDARSDVLPVGKTARGGQGILIATAIKISVTHKDISTQYPQHRLPI